MENYNWHLDPANLHLFEAEQGLYNRGLEGEFKLKEFTTTTGTVTVLGELKYADDLWQTLQIIYPPSFPYSQPKIVAIARPNEATPWMPMNFGKGNQYADGELCLIRKSDWSYQQFDTGWLLRRAQAWLRSATSQAGFTKDLVVDERISALPHTGQVLIPTEIEMKSDVTKGTFVLTQFKANHFILESNVLQERTFPLQLNQEQAKWFYVKPELTFKDFVPILMNLAEFQKFLAVTYAEDIHALDKSLLAFYMPGDENKWHFIRLNQQQRQINYYIGRIIENELYLRSHDIFDSSILKGKKVTIVGVGAIGSEVARSLARNGVGHFNLFDSDTFEIGNSIRHAADLFHIGETKVEVVKQLIKRSNPNITVNAYPIDIMSNATLLQSALANSDIALILTADDGVDYFINDKIAQNLDIPFVFARASIGAFSGSIQVVKSNSACLRCLSSSNNDKLPTPKTVHGLKELPPEYGSCSSPAVPGSEIDTKEISLQVSRVALQLLIEMTDSKYASRLGDQYYWHGPYGSDKCAPFTWEAFSATKQNNCRVCYNKN